MSFLKKMFGGGAEQKKDLSAREGYELALESVRAAHPEAADAAYLCCAYTSVHDSDAELREDGICRAWHFDFFLPASQTLCLVRVRNGKAKPVELSWNDTQKRPVEYVFAKYGMQPEQGPASEPARVPDKWLDSPAITSAALEATRPLYESNRIADLLVVALCLPAECLRYLQEEKAKQQLDFPPAAENCFAAICSTDELYQEDSHLLYIDATTGSVVQHHPFRYPDLFYFGNSINW